MCNVRPEDSGEIKFVARQVDSAAYLDVEGMIQSILSLFKCNALKEDVFFSAKCKSDRFSVSQLCNLKNHLSELTLCHPLSELPVSIVKPLQDKTALEKSRVILDCTVSNPRCSIRWYKGSTVILPSERFEICSEGCYRKLNIGQVALSDAGTYSVQVGEYSCSAKLTVEGKRQKNMQLSHFYSFLFSPIVIYYLFTCVTF